MTPALVLVDFQHEFLGRRPLEPAPEVVVARASALLYQWREWGWPVVHVRLSVTRVPDNRLPHWKVADRWPCLVGTEGHAFPPALEPQPGEGVIDKSGFSGFENPALERWLDDRQAATVVIAGLFSHNCVRATALDAWRLGRAVVVVEDVLGHYDLVEAESTRTFLRERGIQYLTSNSLGTSLGRQPAPPPSHGESVPRLSVPGRCRVEEGDDPRSRLVHHSPADARRAVWSVPMDDPGAVAAAVAQAREAQPAVRSARLDDRHAWLQRLAGRLGEPETMARLARHIAIDVGKPITEARAEVGRCVRLLEAAQRQPVYDEVVACVDGASMRRVPLGTIAAITPWNHPLAIAIGKIAPAVRHGNSVVWKPAPAGSRVALELVELIRDAGWPDGSVSLVLGGETSARSLMASSGIDALSLTGGPAAGGAAWRLAAARHLPLQAELGGNNASVVWEDADGAAAARLIAPAAFGFAGQRCTANRRVIVPRAQVDAHVEALTAAAQALSWGDPLDEATAVGPLISRESMERVTASVESAARRGHRVMRLAASHATPSPYGWYVPPTLIQCENPDDDIVQRESFGPVLVIQPADTWDHAMELVNRVSQGLAAAVFTPSRDRWLDFRDRAQVGIVKWNRATADAGVDVPFGGWKASGYGPPEHGPAQREFYTRMQALYES